MADNRNQLMKGPDAEVRWADSLPKGFDPAAPESVRDAGAQPGPTHDRHCIQSVERAMSIMRQLNLDNGATVQSLAAAVDLPRSTVHRILETLHEAGYARKDPHTRGYWLEAKSRELGGGYSDQSWVLDTGTRVVEELRAETKLGVVLTSPTADGNMIVRVATILRNPAGGARTTAGTRIPMGWSCSGHSYLANCAPKLRDQFLARMFDREHADCAAFIHNHLTLDRGPAEKLLEVIRRQGFAVGHAVHDKSGRLGAVAVPIARGGEAVGSLSLNFYYSSVKPATLNEYIARLKKAAAEIGDSKSPCQRGR